RLVAGLCRSGGRCRAAGGVILDLVPLAGRDREDDCHPPVISCTHAGSMKFIATFQTLDFLDTLLSLAAAFVLGTLIGAERQYRQRTAGLRTNVLVCVGAAAFVDLAMHLSGADGGVRVIAYVVSGIGFLGAGVIMKQGMD